MSVINILSPHVADLIAAGEVVERPASVIKELIENAFDAGANNIVCEIRGGGISYIRVTDDGCGMAPEDAGIAFLRHATSKLADESGLEHIGTMGFRGEALAAISSVSHIELMTRQKGTSEGTRVILDAGDIQDMTACGCPEGTTMIVRDLFFNTPARLKFMKSDRSEASSCITAALRCALGRPEVSVRFIRDGNDEFFSPGDGKIDSCLYSLLGRDEAATMLKCSGSSDGLKIDGFISSPANGRGNRAHQFFFVNGRFIKSALLQSAVEQAYKNSLLVGRYPSCSLYLTIGLGSVDVNVHPAKTEIRFGSEKLIFDFVYQAVKMALSSENTLSSAGRGFAPSMAASPADTASAPAEKPAPKADFYKSMTSEQFRSGLTGSSEGRTASKPETSQASRQVSSVIYKPASSLSGIIPRSDTIETESLAESRSVTSSTAVKQTHPVEYNRSSEDMSAAFHSSLSAYYTQTTLDVPEPKTVSDNHGGIIVENSVQNVDNFSVPAYKILGEAFRTYIIIEQDNDLLLIDKHAAHERMIFDRLKAHPGTISSQMLLAPSILKLSPEEAELIDSNSELLSCLGFEIEPYGEKEYIVRGVPAEMNVSDVPSAIEEICEKLRFGKAPDPTSVRDEILHTVACKAAIKAGWNTHRDELDTLVRAVVSGDVKYCPHGRPVSAVITHKDLDKLFKRIV